MRYEAFAAKKEFVCKTLSRCVAAMYPRVARLEYHLHDGGDEIIIVRCVNGYTRRISVTGMDLRQTTDAVLAEFDGEAA